jgi:hypothetical protein
MNTKEHIEKLLVTWQEFSDKMLYEIIRNIPEKGFTWREIGLNEMQFILKNYVDNTTNYVAIANLAMMMYEEFNKPKKVK